MTNTQITTILFDWDFTLARVLGDILQSERLAALFSTQGLNYTPDQFEAAMEKQQNGAQQGFLGRSIKPQTRQDIINGYFRILAYLGFKDRTRALGERLYSAYGILPNILYDDTLPTLRALQKKGFSLGIISNHSNSAREVIEEKVGEFIRPEHIIISQEIGVHKPAKTIFKQAVARMKVSPANCVFIGDNLDVDAIGAVERGGFSRGFWLDRAETNVDRTLPERVVRITSLDQLPYFV